MHDDNGSDRALAPFLLQAPRAFKQNFEGQGRVMSAHHGSGSQSPCPKRVEVEIHGEAGS